MENQHRIGRLSAFLHMIPAHTYRRLTPSLLTGLGLHIISHTSMAAPRPSQGYTRGLADGVSTIFEGLGGLVAGQVGFS